MPRIRAYLPIILSLGGVVAVQFWVTSSRNVPIIYTIPLLLAAISLPVFQVGAVGVLVVSVNAASIMVERTPYHVWPWTFASLLAVVAMSMMLSNRREAAPRRAEAAEDARAEALKSEERSRIRSEELATVLDAVPAAVWITRDPQALQITGNRLSDEWLRVRPGANVSLSAPDGERPETYRVCKDGVDIPPEEMPVQMSAAGAEIRGFEFALVYPEGTVRHLLGDSKPLFDEGGRPRGSVSAFIDITERKQAEETLRRSEERFRAVFAESPVGIEIYDSNARLVDVNPAVLEMLGLRDAAPVLGFDLLRDADLPEDAKGQLLRGAIIRYDRTLDLDVAKARGWFETVKSGAITARTIVTPLAASGEDARKGYLAVTEDVTERRRAWREREQLLARVEHESAVVIQMAAELGHEAELLRTIMDRTGAQVAYLDRDMNFVRVNAAYVHGCGHTEEELLGRSHFDLFPNEENEAIFKRVADTGERIAFHAKPFDFADQPERGVTYWDWTLTPVKDESGAVQGLVLSLVDVTPGIQSQEALRETRDFLENLLDYANAPIIVWDPEFRITRFNHAFERLTGRRSHEVIGKELDLLFPDDSREESMTHIRRAVAGERWETVEIPILRLDGTVRTVLWNSATLYAPGGETPVATIAQGQDITERKAVESALETLYETEAALRAQLEEQMNRRVEYTRALVHELKTPLTPIMSSTELLLEFAEDETLHRIAQNVRRGAENLNKRIDELLDIARSELGMLQMKPATIDLAALLEQAVAEMEPAAMAQELSLSLDKPASPLPVQGDAERLSQVLLNLLGNACKYCRPGDWITVRATNEGRRVMVEVEDTGPGIPAEARERIFDPYRRFVEDGGRLSGLGLGLALAKTIVEMHRGSIWVESEPGKGSKFSFWLPTATDPPVDEGEK
jgi:PAS domain S-box-containing protein